MDVFFRKGYQKIKAETYWPSARQFVFAEWRVRLISPSNSFTLQRTQARMRIDGGNAGLEVAAVGSALIDVERIDAEWVQQVAASIRRPERLSSRAKIARSARPKSLRYCVQGGHALFGAAQRPATMDRASATTLAEPLLKRGCGRIKSLLSLNVPGLGDPGRRPLREGAGPFFDGATLI